MAELRKVEIYITIDGDKPSKPVISASMHDSEIQTMVRRCDKHVALCVERRKSDAAKIAKQADALRAKLAKYNQAAGLDEVASEIQGGGPS